MGTYVLNVATDDLKDNLEAGAGYQLGQGDLSFLETQAEHSYAQSTPQKAGYLGPLPELPVLGEQDFVFLPKVRNIPPKLKRRIEPSWSDKSVTVRKFVDDNLQCEKTNMLASQTFRVVKSEKMFNHIAANARKRGMIVNAAKNNLLVVSASKSYEARAHFYDSSNNLVESTDSMKAL